MIRAATVRLIPPEQAAELGDRMLIALIEAHGPPCGDPEGERALGALAAALEPDAPPRLRVMDLGRAPAVAALPGGTVLIDRATTTTATPEELAGRVAAAIATDPVRALVADAGILASVRYVFSGHFEERALARAAESAIAAPAAAPPAEVPDLAESDWEALRGICR